MLLREFGAAVDAHRRPTERIETPSLRARGKPLGHMLACVVGGRSIASVIAVAAPPVGLARSRRDNKEEAK